MFTSTQRAVERRVAAYFGGFNNAVECYGGRSAVVSDETISDAVDVMLSAVEESEGVVFQRDELPYEIADLAYDEVVGFILSGRW